MLHRYSCKDMGLNCLFVAKAQTLEEVTKQAIDHVLEAHKADFNSLQTPEEIEKMKQSLARSTRVVAG
jgi:predicted small metal-binding protein